MAAPVTTVLTAAKKASREAFRSAGALLTLEQMFENSVPTTKVVKDYCKTQDILLYTEMLDSLGTLHWIGNRSAQKVIIYFHGMGQSQHEVVLPADYCGNLGGGFALPAIRGHVAFLHQCQTRLRSSGQDVLIAFHEYDLTPKARYPVQYKQAVGIFNHILESGYDQHNIILGGDSCGGNICLALVSIALHFDKTFPKLESTTPIAGMFLISPWTSFSTNSGSYEENKVKDIFSSNQTHEWVNNFVNEDERNEYSEPVRALSSWWKKAPVLKTLVISGDDELFRDDIQILSRRLKDAGLDVNAVNCTNQVHIECILDAETGDEPGQMSFEIWAWLIAVFNDKISYSRL